MAAPEPAPSESAPSAIPRAPAITLELLPAARLAVFTVHRQPSFEEWRLTIETLTSMPEYAPGTAIISDRRAISDCASPETVRRMADYLGAHRDVFAGCRWAVVTHPDNLAEFGMARIGERLFEAAAAITVRAFTDIDEARRWTGDPSPPVDQAPSFLPH